MLVTKPRRKLAQGIKIFMEVDKMTEEKANK